MYRNVRPYTFEIQQGEKKHALHSSWTPLAKGKQVVEIYAKVRQKFPVDKTLTKEFIQGVLKVEGDKSKIIFISQVKEGMMNKALLHQQDAMVIFHDVEGFE